MRDDDQEDDAIMERRHWHFERRISMGEVLTAIGLILTIYVKGNAIIEEFRTAYAQMDKRVSILEVKADAQKQIDEKQDANTRDAQQRIEQALADIQRSLRQSTPITRP